MVGSSAWSAFRSFQGISIELRSGLCLCHCKTLHFLSYNLSLVENVSGCFLVTWFTFHSQCWVLWHFTIKLVCESHNSVLHQLWQVILQTISWCYHYHYLRNMVLFGFIWSQNIHPTDSQLIIKQETISVWLSPAVRQDRISINIITVSVIYICLQEHESTDKLHTSASWSNQLQLCNIN